MKLERESMFSHLTLSHKSEPKSFEYDELSLDSNGLKSGKVVKEPQNKNEEIEDDQLLYLVNASNGEEDFAAPFMKSLSEIEPIRNEPCFYAEKSSDVECEMPELQVCYRECGFASVKDICVDEGVNSRDKILFESTERSLCTFVFHGKEVEKVEPEKDEETESKDDKILPETVTPVKESASEDSLQQDKVSSAEADETTQPTSLSSDSGADKSDKRNTEEAQETEPRNSITANELPYSSKVEKKRITFDFIPTTTSPPPEASELAPQNDTSESPETEIAKTKVEEDIETGLSEQRDSGQHRTPPTAISGEESPPGSQFVSGHFQFGESSFSAAGPMSGRINYSGPVPFSGSISLRSDSSTTSTRSFAFPVLPNEWNSSPIRMAKADRRNFRKHRGWRQGILCCRF